ncbi:uncharacterized protein LAESUDRAFT_619332, partial [Laetiporus sulphureus 93-53]
CLACHGSHRTHECPDKKYIKPRSPCYHCGGDDHWSVDCTAPIEVQRAYRKKCFICQQSGHTARNCTHRVERKPSIPCPACGDPGHWPSKPCIACSSPDHLIRHCPDRTHIKPNVRCRRCGSSDHWFVDCTASSKVRNAYRMTCPICGEKGHPPRDCPNRAQHKPSRPCAACGSPDHWLYDCPD